MANLSKTDIQKLARLSRLALTGKEVTKFQTELSAILKYVEQLKSIDTTGVKPTSQVTGLVNSMREDELREYGTKPEELLKNTPEQQDGYIKVRKVL